MDRWINVLIGAVLLSCFCGCSKDNIVNDDPEVPVTPVEPDEPQITDLPDINGKTFGANDNITIRTSYLSHGGTLEVPFFMAEGQYAQILLDDENNGFFKFFTDKFDLSVIEGNPVKGIVDRPSFIGIGKETIIPIEITPDYKNQCYNFSGKTEISGISITINDGTATTDSLGFQIDIYPKVFFDEITHLYDLIVSKDFDIKFMTDSPLRDSNCHYLQSLFIIDLQSPAYPDSSEKIISLSDLFQLILNTPCLRVSEETATDELISLGTFWGRLFTSFSFPYHRRTYRLSFFPGSLEKDNEGIITYVQYPVNTFCASLIDETSYMLTFDPYYMILFIKSNHINGTKETCHSTLYSLLSNIILILSPGNVEGIPMDYNFVKDSENLRFRNTFADSSTGNSILKSMISVIRDKNVKKCLIEELGKEGINPNIISIVDSAIENMDEILEQSSETKFGWSYVRRAHELSYYYDLLYPQKRD